MRKALIVGVNYYDEVGCLPGCVNDAYSVNSVLEQHSDGTKNFDVKLMAACDQKSRVDRSQLRYYVQELFRDDNEIALFYFSGHGYIENTGGYLVTSDCKEGHDGLSMNEILRIVNDSPAKNKFVVLDTCFSGAMGNDSTSGDIATINEGVTILTASRKDQTSVDEGDGGTFTKLFVDALSGAASNLLGETSPGSVYAHIDKSLGAWLQRPIFKTNVKNFVSLRRTQPPIPLNELKMITELFKDGFEINLDPTYEPESENPDSKNTAEFAVLQKYNRLNLVVPVGAEHMYFAAINSKSCKLTALGEHYYRLAKGNRF